MTSEEADIHYKSNRSNSNLDVRGDEDKQEIRSVSENEAEKISLTYSDAESYNQIDTAYRFASLDFTVPDMKLENPKAFDNFDLTYYNTKCREVLKKIYD